MLLTFFISQRHLGKEDSIPVKYDPKVYLLDFFRNKLLGVGINRERG